VDEAIFMFTVYGTPIPKGSTKAFFRPGMKYPVVTEDNKRTRPWSQDVLNAAREALEKSGGNWREMESRAVSLQIAFYLPRPKKAPKRITRQIRKPDLDKLVRAIKDALTRAGVYRDDAQVVSLVAAKEFAGGPRDPWVPQDVPAVPRAMVTILLEGE
jgi:crossover junction endodeoxyribonuclease RusA